MNADRQPLSSRLARPMLLLAALGLSACATVTVPPPAAAPAAACCAAEAAPLSARAMPGQTVKVMAVGYGATANYSQYATGQQKLMAMRAARVDAYRTLAEQVFGFRVWGQTSVSSFLAQNDSARTYVDAFIQGARLVNMTPIADGNFEATVELELTPEFFQQLQPRAAMPLAQGGGQGMPGCTTRGCGQPSIYHSSSN